MKRQGDNAWSFNLHFNLNVMMCYGTEARVHKTRSSESHGNYIFYDGAKYLSVLNVELTSCYSSGSYKFDVASKYLENLCTSWFT